MEILSGADLLIAIRSGLQKIDGFYQDSFADEEIQLQLNQIQDQFIDELVNDRFQGASVRMDYIRPFLTISNIIPVSSNQRIQTFNLPADYRNYIGGNANITVSTTNYSTNGTRRECLADVGNDPSAAIPNAVSDVFSIKLLQFSEAQDRKTNLFHKSNYRQPFGEIANSTLRIFRDESFIITSVDLEYVIIPPIIDVTSTTATLWKKEANKRLADLTIERLKVYIENQASQLVSQMEQIRNQQ